MVVVVVVLSVTLLVEVLQVVLLVEVLRVVLLVVVLCLGKKVMTQIWPGFASMRVVLMVVVLRVVVLRVVALRVVLMVMVLLFARWLGLAESTLLQTKPHVGVPCEGRLTASRENSVDRQRRCRVLVGKLPMRVLLQRASAA